jgi:hypothetical protein
MVGVWLIYALHSVCGFSNPKLSYSLFLSFVNTVFILCVCVVANLCWCSV